MLCFYCRVFSENDTFYERVAIISGTVAAICAVIVVTHCSVR
jgi:hypothetical protein